MIRTKKKLGDMLLKAGIITQEQLDNALSEKKPGERVGRTLTRLGFVSEETILNFLASQMGIPYIDLDNVEIERFGRVLRNEVLEPVVRRHLALPISMSDEVLTVAMADPLDVIAIDDIRRITGCKIRAVVSSEEKIKQAIDKYYKKTETMEEILASVDVRAIEVLKEEEAIDLDKMKEEGEAIGIIRLVNHLLSTAVELGASDIHIEPYEDELRVRYRIDGVLHEMFSPPKTLHRAVISRFKIISGLNIAERRLPQDGRCSIRLKEKEADMRVSVVPTSYGEKVVARILDPSSLCLDLTKLGFSKKLLSLYEEKIKEPHGIILITGPTGCGKTTTLYSTLRTINTPDKNILTVEDPVEYKIKGLNQTQARPEIGLDFPTTLRSFLRQDPDILFVGEVRDKETAEVAINAALTGHLVFSTLHTNDSVGAIVRLQNMGVEPFLIASTLILSVAQRLIRKICPECKIPYKPQSSFYRFFDIPEDIQFFKGAGCKKCSQIGYKGRIGIFELLDIDSEIADLITDREPGSRIMETAIEKGLTTLKDSAREKVLEGITAPEEAMRVVAG
ncbi:TPA: type II secretion system protein GspE [bacterium]|nr:type II secretion system protein GspE [bacterium]